jgi:hypothetical protein
MISEAFVLYAEFEREGYGYGMGMWGPNSAMMREQRNAARQTAEIFEPRERSRVYGTVRDLRRGV